MSPLTLDDSFFLFLGHLPSYARGICYDFSPHEMEPTSNGVAEGEEGWYVRDRDNYSKGTKARM